MKILSALFDAALVPVALAQDALNPWPMVNGEKSKTRQKIEDIEEDLGL